MWTRFTLINTINPHYDVLYIELDFYQSIKLLDKFGATRYYAHERLNPEPALTNCSEYKTNGNVTVRVISKEEIKLAGILDDVD